MRSLAIAFLVLTLALGATWQLGRLFRETLGAAPITTPISGFAAPFVFGRFTLPEDNPLTNEAVALGRRLFYDPRLSGGNQVSCASCHLQHLAFTDGKKTSIGESGKPLAFNSMSLVNLLWGPRHFFWNGRASSLEEQALIPIQDINEMNQPLSTLMEELADDKSYQELFGRAYGKMSIENLGKALASFQRTLISANSRYDQYLRGEIKLSPNEEFGRKLFMAHPDVKVDLKGGNCIDCHSQFLTAGFSSFYDGFNNNGLDGDEDLGLGLEFVTGKPEHKGFFKVPSLRNIAVTGPYMHDGRFQTLAQVLDHYNEGIKISSTLSPLILEAENIVNSEVDEPSLHLTEEEKSAIIAFLHTLSDEVFLRDEKFSNPYLTPELEQDNE